MTARSAAGAVEAAEDAIEVLPRDRVTWQIITLGARSRGPIEGPENRLYDVWLSP
jgi:hypothetical protein